MDPRPFAWYSPVGQPLGKRTTQSLTIERKRRSCPSARCMWRQLNMRHRMVELDVTSTWFWSLASFGFEILLYNQSFPFSKFDRERKRRCKQCRPGTIWFICLELSSQHLLECPGNKWKAQDYPCDGAVSWWSSNVAPEPTQLGRSELLGKAAIPSRLQGSFASICKVYMLGTIYAHVILI